MAQANLTIYRFNLLYLNGDGTIDYDLVQQRYVAAFTEEEADSKMEAYRARLVAEGYADFRFVYTGVDTDYVIF